VSDVLAHTDPTPETARQTLREGLDDGGVVTVFGRCTVEYDGRASSSLGPGDRHCMCKPDGTILVHTDEGHQPVNWQPPGCTHDITADDDTLVVDSRRESPEERLVVTFSTVDHVAAYDLTDPEDLTVEGTEDDLRDRILADPSLVESGLVPLATERQTSAGAVDVFAEDADGRTVVLELKRRRVGPDAVGQLGRYVDALDRDLHAEAGVRGILVAPSVTDRARRMLAERGLEFVSLEP
jgi:RecB family endonuclease NucS